MLGLFAPPKGAHFDLISTPTGCMLKHSPSSILLPGPPTLDHKEKLGETKQWPKCNPGLFRGFELGKSQNTKQEYLLNSNKRYPHYSHRKSKELTKSGIFPGQYNKLTHSSSLLILYVRSRNSNLNNSVRDILTSRKGDFREAHVLLSWNWPFCYSCFNDWAPIHIQHCSM